MAFYFALLNVSTKKEEPKPHHKHSRRPRRHSIASVESPLLDYRLLPRPQLMGEEGKKVDGKGMRKSESNYSTGGRRRREEEERRRTPDRKGTRPKSRDHSFRDDPRDSGSSAMSEALEQRKRKEPEKFKAKKQPPPPKPRRHLPPVVNPPPNSPAVVGNIAPEFLDPKPGSSKQTGVVRPLFHRRRQSPPDSTTSGSRRSSKGSQNSLPRRDTPSSSSCSRRESGEPPHAALGSLVQASQKLASVHITRPSDKYQHLKKVTFNGAPLVIKNNFLGERAVLVQKGHTVLRRSSTVAQPLAACGMDWWGVCAENDPGEGENMANGAMEEDNKLSRLRPSLLRRRSTSDRGRVAFVLHNEGFLSEQQEKNRKNGNLDKGGCYLRRAGTTKA